MRRRVLSDRAGRLRPCFRPPAVGQVPPPPGPPDPLLGASPDPVLLPTNRKSANQIKAAHEYIAAKDWDNAAKLLQRVLDESEDSLLESEGKDAQGKITVLRSSARAEAERLVATSAQAGPGGLPGQVRRTGPGGPRQGPRQPAAAR